MHAKGGFFDLEIRFLSDFFVTRVAAKPTIPRKAFHSTSMETFMTPEQILNDKALAELTGFFKALPVVQRGMRDGARSTSTREAKVTPRSTGTRAYA